MPHSMTGIGLASGPTEIGELRIEVRTVNGRSLVQKLRLSSACAGFEAAIEQAVRERLRRGTVTVIVERRAAGALGADRETIGRVARELREVAEAAGLPPPTFADVMSWTVSAAQKEPVTSRELPTQVGGLLGEALDDLARHRETDGEATVSAIEQQLAEFERHLESAAARAPQLAEDYRDRLLQRVTEFVQQHVPNQVPAADVVREVAIHADRVDVAEELQRLRAHLEEFRAMLQRGGEVGRRLEFLLQELLRETNTLGSKSPDTSISHTVVAMKSGIDRLKEQVANLE